MFNKTQINLKLKFMNQILNGDQKLETTIIYSPNLNDLIFDQQTAAVRFNPMRQFTQC